MRTSVWIAVSIGAVLLLSGCSAQSASSPPQVASSELNVLGTSAASSEPTPATQATRTVAPNPATVEGIPASLGIQVSAAEGVTAITQTKALEIATKHRPLGAKSSVLQHVLFAAKGSTTPIDAWMATFHSGELPGAGGAPAAGSSPKTGSVTIFVDAKTGDVLDQIAYVPQGK